MPESRPVAVALGSNLGDRTAHLEFAVARLSQILIDLRVSAFIETPPEGVGPQPEFLNAAVVGQSEARPADLLDELMALEAARSRTRPFPGAPRTLDLDLILVGRCVESSTRLHLPHRRFRDRLFVLQPLAEVGPNLVDPVTELTVAALLARLQQGAGR